MESGKASSAGDPALFEEAAASRPDLFNLSPLPSVLLEPLPSLRILGTNPAFAESKRLPRDCAIGLDAREALAEIAEPLVALCERVQRTGRAARATVESGQGAPLELSLDPLLDPAGHVWALLLTRRELAAIDDLREPGPQGLRDVAYYERELAALRLSEEKHRLIATSLPDTAFFQDRELRYRWIVNPAPPLTDDRVVDKTDFDLVREAEARQLAALKGRVLDRGETVAAEVPVTLDGARRWFRTVLRPARDTGGSIDGIIGYSRDVTAEKQERTDREHLLRQLEIQRELLQVVIDNAPAAISLVSGPDLVFEVINSTFQSAVPGRVLVGKPLAEAWPEMISDPIAPMLRHVLQTGEAIHTERSGSPAPTIEGNHFSINLRRCRGPSGAEDSVLSVTFDLTKQERARRHVEALASVTMALNAGKTLSEVMEAALAGVTKALRADDAALWLLDDEAQGLRGAMEVITRGRVGLVVPIEQWPRWESEIARGQLVYLTPPEMEGRAARWLDRAGTWGSINVPLMIEQRCLGLLCINYRREGYQPPAEDLSLARAVAAQCALAVERAHAHEELAHIKDRVQAHAAQLEAIFESLDEGLSVWDLHGDLLSLNSAARRMFGDWLQGKPPESLSLSKLKGSFEALALDGAQIPADCWPLSRILRGEPVPSSEVLLRSKETGRSDVLSLSGALARSPAGEPLAAVVAFRSVAARKESERERERLLAEVQRHADHLEELISVISHDLRTPMTTVQATAHMLQRQPQPPESVQRLATSILTAARRMDRMMRDLVDTSRFEAGELSLSPQPVEIPAFAAELKARLAGVLDVERLEVARPEVPVVALADPDRLERVLTNLIANALKYTSGKVTVGFAQSGSQIETSVRDEGPGIAPEEIPRLFDRFFRGRSASKIEGLGLGLYITRLLVEAHGGRLSVDSQPGCGSSFLFTLPVAGR